MEIAHPDIGVCGLSCMLCPRFHTDGPSRCTGCKGASRMAAGCPFITCAVKRRGIEFCWDCEDSATCSRWAGHRRLGREHDSFVSYAGLEHDIATVQDAGFDALMRELTERAELLDTMLAEFNDGRSKSLFCVAARVLPVEALRSVVDGARREPDGALSQAKALRARLENAAAIEGVALGLRK
jgi:hypothetical protein